MANKDPFRGRGEHLKACAELIRTASHRHRPHQVFSDFCEMTALSISNSVDLAQREARESRYLAITRRYEAEEVALFPQMLAHVVEGLEEAPRDFMGELFMGMDMGNHWTGQFFTPYDISLMMAKLTFEGITQQDVAAKGGFITVAEPACGSGGMILAVAETLRAGGVDSQRQMHATLVDVDATAVHMAYIQVSLAGIPAIVSQGNTLTGERTSHWFTPAHVLGGWGQKLASRGGRSPIAEHVPEDNKPLSH